MKHGKQTCKILKQIRQQIAIENDLFYVTSQCKHKGDCAGTCPTCEAELRYLEEQLATKHVSGKAVAVLGIALGITSFTGLSATNQPNNLQNNSSVTLTNESEINQTQGVIREPLTVDHVDGSMPEYPGGRQAMMSFLSKNTHYPAVCVKDSIQGVVVVQFTVDTTGKVTRAHIVRSVHPELDAEALRVVNSFPAWKPAMQNGKPVASKYTMPVVFRLTK